MQEFFCSTLYIDNFFKISPTHMQAISRRLVQIWTYSDVLHQ